jgi:hypothetical protein
MAHYIAAGEVLLNPALLAYAVVETDSEGPRLRLGFLGRTGEAPGEVIVSGPEARSLLGWLRRDAQFLDSGDGPRPAGRRRGPVIGWRKAEEARPSCPAPLRLSVAAS